MAMVCGVMLHVRICVLVTQSCLTLARPHGLQPSRILCPWDSPHKNTGVGCYSLLQGIFPAQVSNLGRPNCRQILSCLSHQGSLYKITSHCLKTYKISIVHISYILISIPLSLHSFSQYFSVPTMQ